MQRLLRGTLADDVVFQALDAHTSRPNTYAIYQLCVQPGRGSCLTSNGWESGVIPAGGDASLEQVLELSLRQDGVHKVDSAEHSQPDPLSDASSPNSPEVEDLNLREAQSFEEPGVLLVSSLVLIGPEGMGHTVNVVDDGARKIVSRVSLVLGTIQE